MKLGKEVVDEFFNYLDTVVTNKMPMNDDIKAGDLIEVHVIHNGTAINKIRSSVYMSNCHCLAITDINGKELLLKDISINNLIIKIKR